MPRPPRLLPPRRPPRPQPPPPAGQQPQPRLPCPPPPSAAVVASRAAAAKLRRRRSLASGREGLARAALRSMSPLLEIGAAVLRTGRRQTGAVLPCQRPWRRRRRRRRPRWPWVSSSAGCRRQRGALSGVLSLCGRRPRRPLAPDDRGALSAACRAVLCFVDQPVRAAAADAPNTRNNNTHRRRPAQHAPVYMSNTAQTHHHRPLAVGVSSSVTVEGQLCCARGQGLGQQGGGAAANGLATPWAESCRWAKSSLPAGQRPRRQN